MHGARSTEHGGAQSSSSSAFSRQRVIADETRGMWAGSDGCDGMSNNSAADEHLTASVTQSVAPPPPRLAWQP